MGVRSGFGRLEEITGVLRGIVAIRTYKLIMRAALNRGPLRVPMNYSHVSGHPGLLHGGGVPQGLQEDHGVPAARDQAEPRLLRRGHLDHQAEGGQLLLDLRRAGLRGQRGSRHDGGQRQPRGGANGNGTPRVVAVRCVRFE